MKRLFFAMTAFIASMTANAETTTLKFSHQVPPFVDSASIILKGWADRVNEDSNGTLNVKIYPSMTLGGKPAQLPEHAESGFADIIWTLAGTTIGRFPSLEVADYPFNGRNPVDNAEAMWNLYETNPDVQKDLKAYKVIALGTTNNGDFHASMPFTVSDLEGMKLRTPTRGMGQYLGEIGAVGVQVPLKDVGLAVATGVVDGLSIDHHVSNQLKFQEQLPFATDISIKGRGLYSAAHVILMNKAKYESLTPQQKAAIDKNSGLEASVFMGKQWEKLGDEALTRSIKEGMTIVELSDADKEFLLKSADAVKERHKKDLIERGYDADRLYEDYVK